MALYFAPTRRQSLRPRNIFDNIFIDTNLHSSLNTLDEYEDFPFMEHPFRMIRRIPPCMIQRDRRNIEILKENDNKEEKENKKCKLDFNKDCENSNHSPENKEKSLTAKDDFFNGLMNLEKVFPSLNELSSLIKTSDENRFEVNINLRGCDPEKVKVEIKDNVLKVEGSKETSDGSYIFVRHEQTIPKGVPTSILKASLLPEGILMICQDNQREVPVTMITEKESEKSAEMSE